MPSDDGIVRPVRGDRRPLDWQGDRHLRAACRVGDLQMHVRASPGSRTCVRHPGTTAAIERSLYLQSLASRLSSRCRPRIPDQRLNGEKRGSKLLLRSAGSPRIVVRRERQARRPGRRVQGDGSGLYRAGIEVILDVVFNHTPKTTRPHAQLQRLENRVYYMPTRKGSPQLHRLREHRQRQPPDPVRELILSIAPH